MEIDYATIGAKIRYFRVQKKLSQEKLAEITCTSTTYIGYVERGERSPSLKTIIMISNALNVSMDDLLSGILMIDGTGNSLQQYDFLIDCSRAENAIITQAAVSLKEILRQYKLTK